MGQCGRVAIEQGRSGIITASGLTGRCLRVRRRWTAFSLSASHSRWYPPMPLTEGDHGALGARLARAGCHMPLHCRSPGGSIDGTINVSTGPNVGQASGWAWKRRSCRVVELVPTIGAHLEAGHGRVRSVVGQRVDDGVARAALGAVGERVAVAARARVGHLVPGSRGRRSGRAEWPPSARQRQPGFQGCRGCHGCGSRPALPAPPWGHGRWLRAGPAAALRPYQAVERRPGSTRAPSPRTLDLDIPRSGCAPSRAASRPRASRNTVWGRNPTPGTRPLMRMWRASTASV